MNTNEHLKRAFLECLSLSGSVVQACVDVDISRTMVYEWRKGDEVFAGEWDAAKEMAGDALEDEAHRRAFAGSDTLLIFMLKGAKPEKYRDRTDVRASGTFVVQDAIPADGRV